MSTKSPPDDLVLRTAWYDRAGRLIVRTAILSVIIILTIRTIKFLAYAGQAITFPFELDYAEGIVWQQALLTPGPRMYGDITQFPFIVFHYTPIYHLVIRAISALGIDPLVAGRAVTVVATLTITVLAGAVVYAAMREIAAASARIAGAAVAALMVLTYQPVQHWATTMRTDMLAIAFSMGGVYLTTAGRQKTITFCVAVMLFVIAFYTKQSELSAPIAVLIVITAMNFYASLKAIAFGLCLGVTAFIILQIDTGGRFWHHVIEYNVHNRFYLHYVFDSLYRERHNAIGLMAGLMAFAFLWWTEASAHHIPNLAGLISDIRESVRLRALTILSLWFIFASGQLITLGKGGADSNYMIEWMCITAMPIGMLASMAWARPTIWERSTPLTALAGLFLAIVLVEHTRYQPIFKHPILDDRAAISSQIHLVELIRESAKPTLSEDMVLLLRAGQQVPIEPAIFAELAATGIWDQRPFLNLIRNHAFGLVIRTEEADNTSRFTKEESKALEDSYPSIEHIGNYIVRRPSKP